MPKKITDFSKGDKVYHVTNSRIVMVVINFVKENIICRWIDNDGKDHEMDFIPEELAIINPSSTSFVVGKYESRNRY